MTTQLSFGYLQQQQVAAIPRRRVCDLPAEERPLYRLHQVGSSALATSELLALVLGTADAPGLSADLLGAFGSLHQLAQASKTQLMKVRGIGEAQAGRLVAGGAIGHIEIAAHGDRIDHRDHFTPGGFCAFIEHQRTEMSRVEAEIGAREQDHPAEQEEESEGKDLVVILRTMRLRGTLVKVQQFLVGQGSGRLGMGRRRAHQWDSPLASLTALLALSGA